MAEKLNKAAYLVISVLLVAATIAVYYQVAGHGFLTTYDDNDYVTDNPHVWSGLNRESVTWAFTTFRAANWHPLTWLSHMLDCRIFGRAPAGHHLANLLLHIANTLLLFVALSRTTGAVWRSGFVAALFAQPPRNERD